MDERIGELLRILDDNGLYDNSLIVFCSDHGDGAAAHGWNQKWALYEECDYALQAHDAKLLKQLRPLVSSLESSGHVKGNYR